MEELGIHPDTRIYNTLIHGYVKSKDLNSAKSILDQMQSRSLQPDIESYLFFLYYFESTKDLKGAKVFVSLMKSEGKSMDIEIFNTLLKLCLHQNDKNEFKSILNEIEELGMNWNEKTLVLSMKFYIQNKELDSALNLFESLLSSTSEGSFEASSECETSHETKGSVKPIIGRKSFTFLISHFIDLELYEKADHYFIKMQNSNINIDIIGWNTRLKSLIEQGQLKEALICFHNLPTEHHVIPNAQTLSIIVKGLCDAERADEAIHLLEKLNSKEMNCSTLEPIFKYYCENRMAAQAMALFESLKLDRFKMTVAIFNSLLSIVSNSMNLELLDKLWKYSVTEYKNTDKSRPHISTLRNEHSHYIILDAYIKCQRLYEANRIFTEMLLAKIKPDPKLVLELVYANVIGRKMLKASELISWIKNYYKDQSNSNEIQSLILENKKDFEDAIRKIQLESLNKEEGLSDYRDLKETHENEYMQKMPTKEDIIIRIYKELINAKVNPEVDIYAIVMEAHKSKKNIIGVIQVWSSLQKSGFEPTKEAISCLISSTLTLGKQKTASAILKLLLNDPVLNSKLDSNLFLSMADLASQNQLLPELKSICMDLSESGYEMHPELIQDLTLNLKSKEKKNQFQEFIKEYFPQPLKMGLDTFSPKDKENL